MSGSYELDKFIAPNGKEYPLLTRKNANFIEAIIDLDSDYGWAGKEKNEPDPKFLKIKRQLKKLKNPNRHYYGSVAYWAEQLKNPSNGLSFKNNLLGFIWAVDATNSTHLEACVNGRKKMLGIITHFEINNLKKLEKALWGPLDNNSLFYQMLEPIKLRKKTSDRINLSFTSKFFSYASQYLLHPPLPNDPAFLDCSDIKRCNDLMKDHLSTTKGLEYPRYDGIVSSHLYLYANRYLGKNVKEDHYSTEKISGQRSYFDMYKDEYMVDILSIQKALEKDDQYLSLSEIDHIIWYGNK